MIDAIHHSIYYPARFFQIIDLINSMFVAAWSRIKQPAMSDVEQYLSQSVDHADLEYRQKYLQSLGKI